MTVKTVRLLLLSSALGLPLALHAHHSPAMFDFSKQMTLTGTVREFQWTNPHSYIQLVVKPSDGTGAEQEWSLEMGANVYLYERGWRPSTVKTGDTITVTVVPLRSGKTGGGLLMEAKTADGRTLGAHP